MFDSRLPHHAELALWESAGATSRFRWVRFPRSVLHYVQMAELAYAPASETGPEWV